MNRAMQELERTKRAAEVAKSVGEDAATTWNESIRPSLEPLEQQTREQASAIGDEILRAVEAAQGKVREVLGDDDASRRRRGCSPGRPRRPLKICPRGASCVGTRRARTREVVRTRGA